jgi:hypothetical protein
MVPSETDTASAKITFGFILGGFQLQPFLGGALFLKGRSAL